MTLDRVPGDDELYIGGIFTLRRGKAIAEGGITHVVTVLNLPVDEEMFKGCKKRIVFDVDDEESEDIIQHFPESNSFIREALRDGGKVFVHCAMGKSRSATLVIAYLMNSRGMAAADAHALLRQARPLADPNDGFHEQLRLYERMGAPDGVAEQPEYQRWLFQRELERSREIQRAPEHIRFEDESTAGVDADANATEQAREYRCRKCRRSLATSVYVIHDRPEGGGAGNAGGQCAHAFIEPLSWMRPELEQGRLDGRLECPKCRQNVGKYAWQGSRCSCNKWLVPGISLIRSKVDEVRLRKPGSGGGGGGPVKGAL